MIVIIADDLSGAAELAGIAALRGFTAEVQTTFDPVSRAEVIAVDTNTRLLSSSEAARRCHVVAGEICATRPDWIYKKTDSVLRGHVRAEIEAILSATGLARCLFIPANPTKGRLIVSGEHLINGVPLDQTEFSRDPDFPRYSSKIADLLGTSPVIDTPDISSIDDIPDHIAPDTLAAGASDFFTTLLGGEVRPTTEPQSGPTLLISGSLAAWDSGRAEQMKAQGFEVKTIDDPISPDLWQHTEKIMIGIGRPLNSDHDLTEKLIEAAMPLFSGQSNLRIGLEGGATARALISRQGWTRFEVIAGNFVGVGMLRPPGGPILCVKPGSYPWPPGVL